MSTKKNKQEEVVEQVENTATAVLQEGDAEIDTSKPVKFVVTYPHGLNLRIGPGRNFAVKRVLPNGSIVEGVGEVVRAGNVEWVPLVEGWVDGKYLTLAGVEE